MARVHPEIYFFGGGVAEGRATMRELLGGKGANLAEMASLKLPVPPGFTISTRVCTYFYTSIGKVSEGLKEGVAKSVARIEKAMGRRFGDATNPLLVSVRSGARVSMPGMMDTVLNLGLTDETVKGLEAASHNARFAWDSYRRFCQMYGDVVLKLKPENKNDPDPFEELIDRKKALRGVSEDVDLTADDLKELVGEFRELIRAPHRARTCRRIRASSCGRRSARCSAHGTTIAPSPTARSTTSPTTGAPRSPCNRWSSATSAPTAPPASPLRAIPPPARRASTASFCPTRRARTWSPASARRARSASPPGASGPSATASARKSAAPSTPRSRRAFPRSTANCSKVAARLESHFRDMQDIEFTIERGKLFMLQTRNGKRTAEAAVRAAVEMAAGEADRSRHEALMRVEPVQLEQLLHPRLDPARPKRCLARGLARLTGRRGRRSRVQRRRSGRGDSRPGAR